MKPSAKELAALQDALRKDPQSPAFFRLGQAYLDSGQTSDAIEVLVKGLRVHPAHNAARLLLGQALVVAERWKDAALQLLKVIEEDTANADAYALLGEAYLGGGAFDRARTALEKAALVDPRNERVKTLLSAVPPPAPNATPPEQKALAKVALEKRRTHPSLKPITPGVEERVSARAKRDDRSFEDASVKKKPVTRRPPEDPFALTEEEASQSDERNPPRPRVELAPHKQKDAGAAAMRKSAAVEKDYLGAMVERGLLDVPNVTARQVNVRGPRRRRRWGWVLALFVLAGGAGAAWMFRDKLGFGTTATVPADVVELLRAGRDKDYATALGRIGELADKDPHAAAIVAARAEAKALALLDYGQGKLEDVDAALVAARAEVGPPSSDARPGRVELAVAEAARAIAALPADANGEAIARARLEVEHARQAAPDEPLVRWLSGVIAAREGDHPTARSIFENVPLARARVSLGDLSLDEGATVEALAAYDAALKLAEKHPLAVLGRALARIDAAADPTETVQALNVDLADTSGARLSAWKHLALVGLYVQLEQFDKADSELMQADQPGADARLLARLVLLRVDRGQLVEAAKVRARLGGAVDPSLTALPDAELALARGAPDEALARAGARGDRRAHLLRGRALFDQGKYGEAEKELAAAAIGTDVTARAWHELSRVAAGQRPNEASAELSKLARQAVSTLPRWALGEAELIAGKPDAARGDFDTALDGDALAYRARVRLVELILASKRDLSVGEATARAALEQAPEYIPARAVLGRVLVAEGKIADALAALKPVEDSGRAKAVDELALGQALLAQGDREGAKAAVHRALQKGATVEEVAPLANAIDPGFAAELK